MKQRNSFLSQPTEKTRANTTPKHKDASGTPRGLLRAHEGALKVLMCATHASAASLLKICCLSLSAVFSWPRERNKQSSLNLIRHGQHIETLGKKPCSGSSNPAVNSSEGFLRGPLLPTRDQGLALPVVAPA